MMNIDRAGTHIPGFWRRLTLLKLMLAVSVILNIAQAYRINTFISVQHAQSAKLAGQQLKPGTKVPIISAKRADQIDGASETIRYEDSVLPTVIYVFTPQCGWCSANLESIKTLIDERRGQYRFIGISLTTDGLEKYRTEHRLDMPLYSEVGEPVKQAYKMSGTPQTIVISPKGIVVQTWYGAYVGEQKSQVERFFDVKLPKLELPKP